MLFKGTETRSAQDIAREMFKDLDGVNYCTGQVAVG